MYVCLYFCGWVGLAGCDALLTPSPTALAWAKLKITHLSLPTGTFLNRPKFFPGSPAHPYPRSWSWVPGQGGLRRWIDHIHTLPHVPDPNLCGECVWRGVLGSPAFLSSLGKQLGQALVASLPPPVTLPTCSSGPQVLSPPV